jgi:UPF0716 protein FxsA
MPAVLALLFLVVPLIEIAVIIQVGQVIGVWWTIALLLLDSILGAWLVRREGMRAWGAFRRALAEARPPAVEVVDGALVLVGGALLLTPGFATDVVGFSFLVPATRRLWNAFVRRRVRSLMFLGGPRRGGPRGSGGTGSTGRVDVIDIDPDGSP